MNPNYKATKGILSKPSQIGNLKLKQTYFIESTHPTLFVDDNLMAIWINLDSIQFSERHNIAFPISLQRVEDGGKNDFKLLSFPKFKIIGNDRIAQQEFLNEIYEIFNTAFPLGARLNEGENNQEDKELNLEEKVEILHRIHEFDTSQGKLPKNYALVKEKLNQENLNKMNLFLEFIKKLRIIPLKDLLEDKTKSILFGTLSMKDELENQVATLSIEYKKVTDESCDKIFRESFSNIYLLDEQYNNIFSAIGFKYWSNGVIPKTGGAIFIDYGGTGKSLVKAALKDFGKKLAKSVKTECEIKEVTSGEISSYVNSGPQTVQRWYLGSKVSDHISKKQTNLVEKARINQFPSFLIVDEAQDLIKSSELRRVGESDPGTIEPFKRFIQDVNKGGVTGFVITIVIANMRAEEIDSPLSQGGERLKTIWFGHPKTTQAWNEVSKFQFSDKNLQFEKEVEKLPLENIGNILLAQQKFLRNNFQLKEFEEERGGISQRIFGDIVAEFKSQNSIDDKSSFNINKFRHTEDIQKIFNFSSFLEFLIEKAVFYTKKGGFRINEQELREILEHEIELGNYEDDSSNEEQPFSLVNSVTEESSKDNSIENLRKQIADSMRFIHNNELITPQKIELNKKEYSQIVSYLTYIGNNANINEDKKNLIIRAIYIINEYIKKDRVQSNSLYFCENLIKSIIDGSFFK